MNYSRAMLLINLLAFTFAGGIIWLFFRVVCGVISA